MKYIAFVMLLCAPAYGMQTPKIKRKKIQRQISMPELKDLEAQKTEVAKDTCCTSSEPEVKQSCTRMKVALITGATTLVSTAVTAATILLIQHTQPPQ